MKVWKKIVSILLLLHFMFSVTGVVVFQTHCTCTGHDAVGLYVMPETCDTSSEVHEHLFTEHSQQLNHACNADLQIMACEEHHDCGCQTPSVKYFKLKNQFTDKKQETPRFESVYTINHIALLKLAPEVSETESDEAENQYFVPPRFQYSSTFIHFICQPKFHDLA